MLVKLPRKDTTTVVAALAKHVRKLPERIATFADVGPRQGDACPQALYGCHQSAGLLLRSAQSTGSAAATENTNGLVRQYFPRRTDFASISQAHLNAIALRLSINVPPKTLGFKTPADKLRAVLH